jgi:hypothetical protein
LFLIYFPYFLEASVAQAALEIPGGPKPMKSKYKSSLICNLQKKIAIFLDKRSTSDAY